MAEIPVFKERRMTGIGVSGMEESYFISDSYAGILRLSPNSSSTLLDLNDTINVTNEIEDYFYCNDDVTSALEKQFVTVSTSDGILLDMSIRNDAVQFNNLYVLGALKAPSMVVYQTANNVFNINGINMPNSHLTDSSYIENVPRDWTYSDNLDDYYILVNMAADGAPTNFQFIAFNNLLEEFTANMSSDINLLPTGSIHWIPMSITEYEALSKNKSRTYNSDSLGTNTLARNFLICDGSYYKNEDYPELANILNNEQTTYRNVENGVAKTNADINENTFRIPDLRSMFVTYSIPKEIDSGNNGVSTITIEEDKSTSYVCLPLIKI